MTSKKKVHFPIQGGGAVLALKKLAITLRAVYNIIIRSCSRMDYADAAFYRRMIDLYGLRLSGNSRNSEANETFKVFSSSFFAVLSFFEDVTRQAEKYS